MSKIKNAITEMKNAFDRLINRLDIAEESISEPEERSTEIPKIKMKRGERGNRLNKIPRTS